MDDYLFSVSSIAAADTICQRKAAEHLEEVAEGVEKIEFGMPDYWSSSVTEAPAFNYSNLTIESRFGDVEAAMTCLVSKANNPIVETAFSFGADGFLGLKQRYNGGAKPGERPSFAFTTSSPLHK
ncbi:hypothetical protein ACFP4H_08440 [Pseudophaeobacter arcticus]|uniref:hypothetical protein n=1 Tax=Pseudophaeobacter arcticus TaxID=385492 RepID=UPI00042358C6|nr:hypothetical protein [Pseudophaeobacter arcticus]